MKFSRTWYKVVAVAAASAISTFPISLAPSYAQDEGGIVSQIILGDITVGNVRKALIEALEKIEETTRTAGSEARTTGDSLERNGKNLIKEFDEKFGNRTDKLIRALNESERKFMQDVGKTIVLTNQASKELVEGSGQQARLTLFEADILAFNTTYSLPCRNKTPRIVYVADTPIIVGDGLPAVKIRGNFLDQGRLYTATVDGEPSKVLARSANELTLEIPNSVLNNVTAPKLYQVSIKTQQTKYVPLVCIPRVIDTPSPLQIAVELQPQKIISVDAKISGNYILRKPDETTTETREFQQERVNIIDNDCAINATRKIEYPVPHGWSIEDVKYTQYSSGGSSYKEGIDIYSDKVVVRIRLIGKGYRIIRDPITGIILYKNCNGRGWVNFSIAMVGKKSETKTFPPETVPIAEETHSIEGTPGQTSFVLRHSMAGRSLSEASWKYTLTINRKVGRKVMPPIVLSEGNQTDISTNTTTTINDGTLSIQMGNP